MVENVDGNEKITEEERRQEVHEKAEQNQEIDTKTAAFDKENKKIVDIDDVIAKNPDLSFRINNLQKIGIGMERIRTLVALQGNYSIGDTEQMLEESIETVFDALVRKISERPNGIVLNSDGTVNPEKSEAQRIELSMSNNVSERLENSYILRPEESKTIFEELFKEEKEENKYIENIRIFDRLNDYGISPEDYDFEKIVKVYEKGGVTAEERQKNSELEKGTYIEDEYELNFIRAIYALESAIESGATEEKINELKEALRKASSNIHPEEAQKILNADGEIDLDKTHEYRKKFQDGKNITDTIREMESIVTYIASNLEDFDTKKRSEISLTIIKAYEIYKKTNNHMLGTLMKEIGNAWGIEFSFKGMRNLALNNYMPNDRRPEDANFLTSLLSEEEFNNWVEFKFWSTKNYEIKCNRVENSLRNQKKENSLSITAQLTYIDISNYLNESVISQNNTDAMYEILKLYQGYYDKTEKTPRDREIIKLLANYITINSEHIEEYVDFGSKEKDGKVVENHLIHGNNNKPNIAIIRDAVEKHKFSYSTDKRIADLRGIIEGHQAEKEEILKKSDTEVIDQLKAIANRVKKSRKNEKNTNEEILNFLEKIDITSLDDGTLKWLKRFSKETCDVINQKTEEALGNRGNRYVKANIELDMMSRLEENLLLFELKAESDRSIDEQRSLFYQENANYQTLAENIIKPNIRKDKLEAFKTKLLKESILYNIENVKPSRDNKDEMDRYSQILLAGLSLADTEIIDKCIEKLKEFFPEFNSIKKDEIIEKAFDKFMGDGCGSDAVKRKDAMDKVKSNVLNYIITNTPLLRSNGAILDCQFDAKEFQEINIIQGDYTKSELQRKFEGSKMYELSEKEDKLFNDTLNNAIFSTWIDSKEKFDETYYLIMSSILEEIKSGRIPISGNQIKVIQEKLEAKIKENPELKKNLFDENGKILPNVAKNYEKFKEQSAFRTVLTDGEECLSETKDYSEMNKAEKYKMVKTSLQAIALAEHIGISSKEARLLTKVAGRILEKMSDDKTSFLKLDKNGNIIIKKERLLEEAKVLNINNRSVKNYADLIDKSYSELTSLEMLKNISELVTLKEDEFKALNGTTRDEKISDAISKQTSLRNKFKEKAFKNVKKKTIDRRWKKVEIQVLKLSEEDLEDTYDPAILAVWYDYHIKTSGLGGKDKEDLTKKYDKIFMEKTGSSFTVDQTVRDIKNDMFKSITTYDQCLPDKDEQEIFKQFEVETFKELKNKNRTKVVNAFMLKSDLKDNPNKGITLFKQEDIDHIGDETLSILWYNYKSNKYNKKGMHEEENKLKSDFKNKYGIDLEKAAKNLEIKASTLVDKLYNGGRDFDVFLISDKLISKSTKAKMELYSNINKEINSKKNAVVRSILEETFKNKTKAEEIAILSELCINSKSKESEKSGISEAVEVYILSRKKEYPELIDDDKNVSVEKMRRIYKSVKYAREGQNHNQKVGNSDVDEIRQKMIKKINVSLKEDKYWTEFYNVMDALNQNTLADEKNRQAVYDSIKYLKEHKLITPELGNKISEQNPDIMPRVDKKLEEKRTDTFGVLFSRVVDLAGKSIVQIPSLFQSSEKRDKFFEKITNHISSGTERFAGVLDKTTKSTLKRGLFRTKKHNGKALKSADMEKLPAAEVEEKTEETTIEIPKKQGLLKRLFGNKEKAELLQAGRETNKTSNPEGQSFDERLRVTNVVPLSHQQYIEISRDDKGKDVMNQGENMSSDSSSKRSLSQEEVDKLIASMKMGEDRNESPDDGSR